MWRAQKSVLDGWRVTAGIECMNGSAIYLMTTGISKSHARIVLSSDVVTNRRFSSTNVIVFTGPRCWSYSWVISPESMSYWNSMSTATTKLQEQRGSPELFSYRTFPLRRCFVCRRPDGTLYNMEFCHYWTVWYTGQSLCPITSFDDRSRKKGNDDRH